MKKATELLERLSAQLKYNTDTLSLEVCEYVRVRKELEQTPITEDWLLKHGWKVLDDRRILFEKSINNIPVRFNIILKEGITYPTPMGIRYIRGFELKNVAQLIDVFELCGIELE